MTTDETTSEIEEERLAVHNSRFSRELREAFLKEIEAGHLLVAACGAVGITPRTLNRWKQYAQDLEREDQKAYAEFFEQVEIAMAKFHGVPENTVLAAIKAGDSPSARWWLERNDAPTYGTKRAATVQVTAQPGSEVNVVLTHVEGDYDPSDVFE